MKRGSVEAAAGTANAGTRGIQTAERLDVPEKSAEVKIPNQKPTRRFLKAVKIVPKIKNANRLHPNQVHHLSCLA